jgi:KDO2-lipid IV(A) lauroyltransferase
MAASTVMTEHLVVLMTRSFLAAASLAPQSVCRNIGRRLGSLVFHLNSRPRRIAQINIKFAFQNELTDTQAMEMVHRNFQQWGMIALEWAKLPGFKKIVQVPEPVGFEVVGRTHWQKAKEENKALLLLGAHFGNWEYCHGYYASKLDRLNFIVRSINNKYIEKKRLASNTQLGVNILYKDGGLKPAIKNIRKGQDLIVFADQNVNEVEGVECRFFGHRTSTLTILASLAKKYHLPVLPIFCVRKQHSGVHQITFLEPLAFDRDATIPEIAQMQNDVIEKMVRTHPDHWLWMHRKWKHYHPEIYKGV